ncbi:hypothetical protein F2Q69_00003582 [Brassica cretica]|uniref:Uncharacterized protein n=1 Tax=Brassica cretica TaxID=69181 RepID=A0A8S9NTS1_BRACR|nr:hypothetical protein F2Q69_00003582 [Brassica cretica]
MVALSLGTGPKRLMAGILAGLCSICSLVPFSIVALSDGSAQLVYWMITSRNSARASIVALSIALGISGGGVGRQVYEFRKEEASSVTFLSSESTPWELVFFRYQPIWVQHFCERCGGETVRLVVYEGTPV